MAESNKIAFRPCTADPDDSKRKLQEDDVQERDAPAPATEPVVTAASTATNATSSIVVATDNEEPPVPKKKCVLANHAR